MNDFSLRAFIANLDKYNEGELVGEWVNFPISSDEMQDVLNRIGIGDSDPFGNIYDEIFITDMTTNLPQVSEIITAYENVEKLNYYAACVQALPEEEFAKYKAVLEEGKE
ncbi:MAG: antirestriction protein ArdA, partial [Oscillospiraceae bacterium]|nr:antirestriction protein ArdA [Oscillospiraceae bacterium]